MDTRRVDMTFGIGYGSDLRKAKQILEASGKRRAAHPERSGSHHRRCRAGRLLGQYRGAPPGWKTADYWGVWFDFHEKVKLTFDAEGIEIPFPQMVMHMQKPQA